MGSHGKRRGDCTTSVRRRRNMEEARVSPLRRERRLVCVMSCPQNSDGWRQNGGGNKTGVGGEPHVQAKVVESAGDGAQQRLARLRADETASSANCGAEGEELCWRATGEHLVSPTHSRVYSTAKLRSAESWKRPRAVGNWVSGRMGQGGSEPEKGSLSAHPQWAMQAI